MPRNQPDEVGRGWQMSQTGLGGMAKEVSYVRTKVLLAKNVGNRHKSQNEAAQVARSCCKRRRRGSK